MASSPNIRSIPPRMADRLRAWQRNYRFAVVSNYVVGILGIVASAIAAAGVESLEPQAWAIVAGVCVAVLGFAKPMSIYDKYVRAYRRLNLAAADYEMSHITEQELSEAYHAAEQIIATAETGSSPATPKEGTGTSVAP